MIHRLPRPPELLIVLVAVLSTAPSAWARIEPAGSLDDPAHSFATGVDESTGAATVRIPLVVPPGPAGHQPELALQYTSGDARGGAGWAGFGWRIDGESRIVRSSRRGVPYDYEAGRVCGGELCYLDRFELDGADLVCAAPGCAGGLYRTRNDRGRRIVYLGEAAGWQVRDRQGRLHVYGASASHRIVNPRNGRVYAWLLERVEDVHSNWIAYAYDLLSGDAYLRRIEYAQAGAAANRSVEFLREPRPDRVPDFRRGFRSEPGERLARIEVRADPGGLVTAYELAYVQGPTSGRSLLASLVRLGADDDPLSALPPYVFEYSFRETDPQDGALAGFAADPTSFEAYLQIDFRGLAVPDGSEGLADLNGDAIVDFYDANLIAGTTRVSASNGVRFDLLTTWDEDYLRFWWGESGEDWSGLVETTLDLDGDGAADHVQPDGVRLGTASGFAPAISWSFGPDEIPGGEPSIAFPVWPQLTWESHDDVYIDLLDLTGDGRPDRLHCKYASQSWSSGADGWRVRPNLGLASDGASGGFAAAALDWPDPMGLPCSRGSFESWAFHQTSVDVATLDVNGDGLPDHLRSGTSGIHVAFNYGAGFAAEELALDVPYRTDLRESAGLGHWYAQPLDLNGDGFLDHVASWSSWAAQSAFGGPPASRPFWAVWFGDGGGFRSEPRLFRQCHDPEPWNPLSTWCTEWPWEFVSVYSYAHQRVADFADFDGDGLVDRFYQDAGIVTLNAGPHPDLLVAATAPGGARVEFAWGTSAEQRIGDLPANPELPRSRPVVARHTRFGVVDDYHYAGGRHDAELGLFLGFAEVERRELSADGDALVRTGRAVDVACAGRIEHVEVEEAGAILLERQREYLRLDGPDVAEADRWHACLLAAETEWAREGLPLAESRARRTEYDYGPVPEPTAYNVLRIDELGEIDPVSQVDIPGDERSTRFEYSAPNVELNLVSSVAERWVEDPAQPGVRHGHTRFFYDDEPFGAAPSAGQVRAVERWYADPDDPNRVPGWLRVVTQEFDAFGNPTTRSDAPHETPAGMAVAKSTSVRDAEFATFPVARIVHSDAAGTPAHATSFDYADCSAGAPPPALGLACRITRPDGTTTRLGFDALGRVTRIERPNGRTELRTYVLDESGRSVSTAWVLPGDETLGSRDVFDAAGRLVARETPGTHDEVIRVELAYDDRGRLASETAPFRPGTPDALRVRRFVHDGLGRLFSVLEPDGSTLRQWIRTPWSVVEETWLDGERAELGERWRDGLGRHAGRTRYADAAAALEPATTTLEHDVLDRPTRIHDPIANGAPCAEPVFCPGQLHHTAYTYDTLGRRVRIEDPDSGVARIRYDAAGRVVRRSAADGGVESLDYDALGRRVARRFSTGPDLDASFAYHDTPGLGGFGRLRRVDQPAAGIRYEYLYDAAGRVAQVDQVTADLRFTHLYGWDALDRVATHTFPDGETFVHVHDGMRLVRIDLEEGFGPDILLGAEYDAAGNALRLEVGGTDLLDPGSPAARLERDYDPATGRLTAMRAFGRGHASEPALSLDYELDGLGRVVASDGREFGYDGLGRLTRATGPLEHRHYNPWPVQWSFDYDALGNLRAQTSTGLYSRSWSYEDPVRPNFLTGFEAAVSGVVERSDQIEPDAAGRPARIGDDVLVWNAMGRLSFRGDPWTNGVRYWDAFGNPAVRWFLGTELIRVGSDFEYDTGLGQGTKFFRVGGERIASRAVAYAAENAWLPAWWARLQRTPGRPWTGLAALTGAVAGLCLLGAAAHRRRWATSAGIGCLCAALVLLPFHGARAVIGNGGGPEWHGGHGRGLLVYANDALGSVRAVVGADGETVERRAYAPFGANAGHAGEFDLKHRFTGQPHDDRIRLYDYGARMYDPVWGRFLTPDEVDRPTDPRSSNPYAYVENRPTSLVDPDGRIVAVPLVAGVATLVASSAFLVAQVSDDPATRVAANSVASVALLVALPTAFIPGAASAGGLFTFTLGLGLGLGNAALAVAAAVRDLTVRAEGVDAVTFSGQRGGIRKIEIQEGTSIHDIQRGRIEFRDGSSVEIRQGEVQEGDAGTRLKAPSASGRLAPQNVGREGRVGSHSLHAAGAHAGGNFAQTAALNAWVDAGGMTLY